MIFSFKPTCGLFVSSIQCLKETCGRTFGNECEACSDKNIDSYFYGDCTEIPQEYLLIYIILEILKIPLMIVLSIVLNQDQIFVHMNIQILVLLFQHHVSLNLVWYLLEIIVMPVLEKMWLDMLNNLVQNTSNFHF